MSKVKELLNSLNRSTRITLLSCVCFIIMTVLILAFFILFPITPSEKVMASIGRENIFHNEEIVTTTTTSTTTGTTTTTTTATTKKTSSHATKTVNIVITSGAGFVHGGRIPTGGSGYTNTATTPVTTAPVTTAIGTGALTTGPVGTDIPTPPATSEIPPATEPTSPPPTDPPAPTEPPTEGGNYTGNGDPATEGE